MAYDENKIASVKALKETALRVKMEYLAAISKAGHARFQKADAVPEVEAAEDNVLYLVLNEATSHYDVYALIDGKVELLDDTPPSIWMGMSPTKNWPKRSTAWAVVRFILALRPPSKQPIRRSSRHILLSTAMLPPSPAICLSLPLRWMM